MATNGGHIYQSLGIRPVINAGGNTTMWGGSTPSDVVRKAMDEADGSWVEMRELLDRSGEYIASVLEVEAAYVTSGCFAALVLSTAACIAGTDPKKISILPDTTGMKNEIVALRSLQYPYQRSHLVAGGVLVEVGDEDGCTESDLVGGLGNGTAAVAYIYQPEVYPTDLALEDVVRLAHARDVPVIVDAASEIYPLDHFKRTAQSGDLVCFGAKYINAPHSAGFVCGRKALVAAVAQHSFIGFETTENPSLGRGYKLDRQDIVGVVAALGAWFSMDHEERLTDHRAMLAAIQGVLTGIPNVSTKVVQSSISAQLSLHVTLEKEIKGRDAQQLFQELLNGSPRIRVSAPDGGTIAIVAHTLNDGEEIVIADRLRGLLIG